MPGSASTRLIFLALMGLAQPLAAQLVVHLTFDNANALSADSSGNSQEPTFTQGTLSQVSGVSGGAAVFDGNTFLRWDNTTNVVSTLTGSFTVAVWINTTQTYGSNSDRAWEGVGIVYADQPGQTTDTVPIALNGTVAGFMTSDGYQDTTIHTTSSISTGSFVHVVAVYDHATGLKELYFNGALQASETVASTTHATRGLLVLGANDFDSRNFSGQLDDFQFYSTALTATEVAYLHSHPGLTTIPEPSTFILLGLGLGLGLMRRWRR